MNKSMIYSRLSIIVNISAFNENVENSSYIMLYINRNKLTCVEYILIFAQQFCLKCNLFNK